MSGRDNLRSRFLSTQKPAKRRKRRKEAGASRDRVDLVELHTRLVVTGPRRKASKATWIGAILFLIAVPGFFIMGCSIAALSVSSWVKVSLAIPIGILGFILSYIVAKLLH